MRSASAGLASADFLGTAAPAGQLLRGDKVALAEVITEALDQPGHLAAVLVQRRAPVAAKLPLGQFEAGQPAGLLLLPLGLLDLLASLLHRIRRLFARPSFQAWLHRLTGLIFICFAFRLALEKI